jgi:DNA-binding FadR family transcriptional regulator
LDRKSTDAVAAEAAEAAYRRKMRSLAARIGPTLTAMAQLAASSASEADIANLLTTRDRMDSAIAAMDGAARGEAYRAVITRLAAATGNSFYPIAAAQLLAETSGIIDRLMEIDLKIYTADSEHGELRRMLEAIAARNPVLAAQAAHDHALIIAMRLDRL